MDHTDGEPKTVTVQHLGEEIEVGKRLYVGNLPYRVRWQDLKDHFKECGEVVYADVKADRTGRSAGCGIVEYRTAQEAADAMVRMHDTDLKGRKIFVRQDKEDRDLGGRGGGGRSYQPGKGRGYGKGYNNYGNQGYGGGGRGSAKDYGRGRGYDEGSGYRTAADPQYRCFVGNLAWKTTWQDLKDHFRKAGNVVRADVFMDRMGRSSGNGIVEFSHPADAERAIREMNGSILQERELFVREDRDGPKPKGRGY